MGTEYSLTILQAIVLGIVQGATEFIPVSSSGHLLLIPWLMGWDSPGLTFTIFAHLGTAVGVLINLWDEWLAMLVSLLRWLRTREVDDNVRLVGLLLIGLLPAVVVGLLFSNFFERVFTKPLVAALMLLVTAAFLVIGERVGKLKRSLADMTWKDALIIGMAQALAIFPGLSRSGSTIAAARARDFKREDAARYSFMLLMPIVFGVSLLKSVDLARQGVTLAGVEVLLAAFFAALISAVLVMRWLLNYLRTRSTAVFAIYCVAASLICLTVFVVRG